MIHIFLDTAVSIKAFKAVSRIFEDVLFENFNNNNNDDEKFWNESVSGNTFLSTTSSLYFKYDSKGRVWNRYKEF